MSMAWVVLAAAVAAALYCGFLTWSARRATAELRARGAEIEAQLAPHRELEEKVERLAAAKKLVETKKALLRQVRARQQAAAKLLSAMGAALDPRVELVKVTPAGGTIGGRADTPLAANEVGERLDAAGLFRDYGLESFRRGAFTLTFTLEEKAR
jgi:Tfp pilus assembly protein PilN